MTDPKMKKIVTFLQLMQLQISELAPQTDLWTAELPSLEQATHVDLSSITQDMERIGEGVGELVRSIAIRQLLAMDRSIFDRLPQAKNLKEISEGEAAAAIEVGFPLFSAIFNRNMQKLPPFSCILRRNEGQNRSGGEGSGRGRIGVIFRGGGKSSSPDPHNPHLSSPILT